MEERGKIKILQLITRSDWTGAQKVLYSIVYGLKKYYPDQFEVEVACGPENGQLVEELKKINVKVHVIPDLVREISPVKDLRADFQIKIRCCSLSLFESRFFGKNSRKKSRC